MVKQTEPKPSENLSQQEISVIRSLLNYPTLERVFDSDKPNNLVDVKQKMTSAIEDLERVIRRGNSEDAAKAVKAVDAYKTTLNFLNEIENLRRAK